MVKKIPLLVWIIGWVATATMVTMTSITLVGMVERAAYFEKWEILNAIYRFILFVILLVKTTYYLCNRIINRLCHDDAMFKTPAYIHYIWLGGAILMGILSIIAIFLGAPFGSKIFDLLIAVGLFWFGYQEMNSVKEKH